MSKHAEIRKELRQFYNQVAEKFSSTRKYWWRDLHFIKKYLKREGKVLDFACGNGRLLEFLAESKLKYTGVDTSEELIKIAQKKYPKELFLQIENEGKLPFNSEEFDMIFAIAVFHHFTPKMADNALLELKRVLKNDGVLVLTIWNLWSVKYLKFLVKSFFKGSFDLTARISFEYQNQLKWRFCYWWTKRMISSKINDFGFKIMEAGFTFGYKKKTKEKFKRNIFVVAKKMA